MQKRTEKMKKQGYMIATGAAFILAAGVIETMPIVSAALLAVMAVFIKKGELYNE